MKTPRKLQKVVTVAALSGGMALGLAGMAGAAGTVSATPATHTANCTRAEARVPKIQARETKAATWVAAAKTRESAAVAGGHPKVAARIGRRITRVERAEARGEKVLARIAADCGGSTSPSPTPAS